MRLCSKDIYATTIEGLPAEEYPLLSLRMDGATLVFGGAAAADVIQTSLRPTMHEYQGLFAVSPVRCSIGVVHVG